MLACNMQSSQSGESAAMIVDAPVLPPPGLHWIVVLILSVVTLGIFADIWLLVQAWWARKIDPSSKALWLLILAWAFAFGTGFRTNLAGASGIVAAGYIAGVIVSLWGVWNLKSSLERYMISVDFPDRVSGKMTILFSVV